jgi:hypothetical protein
MNPKRRRSLIGIIILAVGGVLVWHVFLTPYSTIKKTSPSGRYIAIVRSSFSLFGGYCYNLAVKRSNGEMVSHLVIDDKIVGWGHDPSVTWTADSKTVTVGLEDGDAGEAPLVSHKRISIDVQP